MNRAILLIAMPAWVLLSTACGAPGQVANIDKRTAAVEAELIALKASVASIERQQRLDELTKNWDAIAYLTPGSEGYNVIQTDLGRLTVKLVNVQPYANGSRVTLQFGNLLSASINGAQATLEWGSVDEKGSPNNEGARSRGVKFTESLRGGAWTNAQVVLEGIPATDLGFVRIKEMTHTGVSLLR